MSENKFRVFKEFYPILIVSVGVGLAVLILDDMIIGISLSLLALAHHHAGKAGDIPATFTLLIHAYGIGLWIYIHSELFTICPQSALSRLIVLMLMVETWLLCGTLYSKSIRQEYHL